MRTELSVSARAGSWMARRPDRLEVILVCSALIAACSPAAQPACAAIGGGQPDARVQLRFVDVGEGFVAFTFGFSSAARTFDIPGFDVTPALSVGIADYLPARSLISFVGASAVNPDGTRSYTGPDAIRAQRTIVQVATLADSSAATMRWEVLVRRATCPRVLAKRYGTGSTFPRAQVVVLFDAPNAITLESPIAGVNEPVLVSGVGFTPGTTVVVRVDGRAVSSAPAKPDGAFESVFFVPQLRSGRHAVTATDRVGPTPSATLEVSPPP